MLKLTLENGIPVIGVQRPRIIKQYVPLAVMDRVKELTDQLNKGAITQASVDEQWGMYVLPHLKLPADYNPQTDVVRLYVKRAIQSVLIK